MSLYFKLFLIAFPIFVILDFLWLGVFMNGFYLEEFGSLARRSQGKLDPYLPSAIICYLLLVIGLVIFVLPGFAGKPIDYQMFLQGALFGLVVYGVYEFTNHAILANWHWKMVIVDTLWGIFLYGITAYLSAHIARYFKIL
jgi:uncharacterized membrane protein